MRHKLINGLRTLGLHVSTGMVLMLFLSEPAQAYIGPGAGLGAIAVTVALGLGVILLLVGLVWYPLKRLFKKNTADTAAEDTQNTPK
jgi:TM2 domain-containing membrane protein YozV